MSKLSALLLALAALIAPTCADAQLWPSGPIRIIVPFPPGGSVDVVARLAQVGLAPRLTCAGRLLNLPWKNSGRNECRDW